MLFILPHTKIQVTNRNLRRIKQKLEKCHSAALKPVEFYENIARYDRCTVDGIFIELGIKHDWPASFRELTGKELERIPQMTPCADRKIL